MGLFRKKKRARKSKEEAVAIRKDLDRKKRVEEVVGEGGVYWDMIENSDSLIQSVDPEGNSFYVNRRWLETLGYTRDEASGLSFLYVIHPDCRDHCHSIFKELMNGESFSRVECDFMSRSREKLAVEGNVSCHFEKGRPIATRGFFRATRGGEGCGEISGEEPPAAEKLDGIPLEDLYLVFRDLLSGC